METLEPLTLLVSAVKVSGPTFAWVMLGVALRRVGLIGPQFINRVSRFAFTLALPFVLFAGATQVDYAHIGSATYLLAGVLSTLLSFTLSWFYGTWRGFPRHHLGIFVQGAFRSNLAVVGVALCIAAYGERGLVLAALPIAVMTVLYNVLVVWILDVTLGAGGSFAVKIVGILKNPLIVGIVLGSLISVSGLILPPFVGVVSTGVSSYFIPLLLVCIGGSIQLSGLKSLGTLTWEASWWRLIVSPSLGIAIALFLGVRGEALGVLFLLLSSPVATASFVMVVAARGDGPLAANIIVLTTLLSLLSVTAGFFALSLAGLV